MSKKETEIQVVDIPEGVALQIGKKIIRKIIETDDGHFQVLLADNQLVTTAKTYSDAEEEAIRSYNLSL